MRERERDRGCVWEERWEQKKEKINGKTVLIAHRLRYYRCCKLWNDTNICFSPVKPQFLTNYICYNNRIVLWPNSHVTFPFFTGFCKFFFSSSYLHFVAPGSTYIQPTLAVYILYNVYVRFNMVWTCFKFSAQVISFVWGINKAHFMENGI